MTASWNVTSSARTCTVEPGLVLDVLNNEHLKPYGLRFGPEPATHMNCTLDGMIGNNSCGATAQRTGIRSLLRAASATDGSAADDFLPSAPTRPAKAP